MIIIKEAAFLSSKIQRLKNEGNRIAFIPTMGALHQGHLSLIKTAKLKNELTVCSIFVNPTQFNLTKDFEKYPNTIEKDMELLESTGCTILFLPSVDEIYTTGIKNLKQYDLGYLETVYDGTFRPGHFQGVCNVVERLFKIVQPDTAYFGLKDYQQCMVIKKLVQLMGWEQQLQLFFCDTLREPDGLAMSSRNLRLSPEERAIAPEIAKTLQWIKTNINEGAVTGLVEEAKTQLNKKGFQTDYLDIANALTLQPVHFWDGKEKIVVLVAAFLNEVRLIDNLIIN